MKASVTGVDRGRVNCGWRDSFGYEAATVIASRPLRVMGVLQYTDGRSTKRRRAVRRLQGCMQVLFHLPFFVWLASFSSSLIFSSSPPLLAHCSAYNIAHANNFIVVATFFARLSRILFTFYDYERQRKIQSFTPQKIGILKNLSGRMGEIKVGKYQTVLDKCYKKINELLYGKKRI